MRINTRNYVPRPAETLEVVDGVNTPPSHRKSYFKVVLATFFVILAALGVKYAPAAAASPTMAQQICTMMDQGASTSEVVEFVIDHYGMLGEYNGYNASILAQSLTYETCPAHADAFGNI